MKKLILSVLICFAFMASVNAQSVVIIPAAKINEVYQQVLKLNADRFANVNRIQIGDTVVLPSLVGGGNEFMIASEPSGNKHDCLYRISAKYLCCELKTQPVEKAQVKPILTPTNLPKFIDYDFWVWFVFIGLCVLITTAYLLNRFRPWNNRRNINRNPVISGGLSNNPAEAAAQVSVLIPGSVVTKSEEGRLIGTTSVKIKMNFSDGTKRVKLISGEEYYRITQANGTIRYARKACGNLADGSISGLPEGWNFIPSMKENSVWPISESVEETKTEIKTEEELPLEVFVHVVEDSALTGKDVAIILESAGKMKNVPSSITYGDLVVRFYKEKETGE